MQEILYFILHKKLEVMEYLPGNVIQIIMKNFRGVRDLKVVLSPKINYFIAPNGHGKSSILMAIQLACGSENKELEKPPSLIYEGEESASIELWVATEKLVMTPDLNKEMRDNQRLSSIARLGVVISENGFKFSQNFKNVNRTLQQKFAYKYNIFVDNPFASMTQLEAQKVMDSKPETRLEQLILLVDEKLQKPIKAVLSMQDNYKPFYERYQLLVKNFMVQKTVFTRGMIDYRSFANVEILKKRLERVVGMNSWIKLRELLMTIEQFQKSKLDYQQQLDTFRVEYNIVQDDKQLKEQQIDLLRKDKSKSYNAMQKTITEASDLARQVKVSQRGYTESQNRYLETYNMFQKQNQDQFQQMHVDLAERKQQFEKNDKEILDLRKQLDGLINSGEKGGDINQIMGSINKQLQQVENQIESLNRERMMTMNFKFVQWFQLLQRQSNTLIENDKQFIIFPVISQIAVDYMCVIPISIARKILVSVIGFTGLFSSITNSFSILTKVSKLYDEVKNTQDKASQINMLKEIDGKTYEQAFQEAARSLQNKQKKQLRTRLQEQEYCYCSEILIGNPIVVRNYNQTLEKFVYISETSRVSDDYIFQEINKIFENNENVLGIFYKDRGYTSTRHDGQLVGRSVSKFTENNEIEQLIKQKRSDEFQHEFTLRSQLKDIQSKKKEKELELQDIETLLQERRNKINQINSQIHRLNVEKGECQDQIFSLERRIKSTKPVTEEEVNYAKRKVDNLKMEISQIAGKLYVLYDNCIKQQFEGSEIVQRITNLEKELDILNGRSINLKTNIDEVQRSLSNIEQQLGQNIIASDSLKKHMPDLPENNQIQYLESQLTKAINLEEDLKVEMLDYAHCDSVLNVTFEVADAYQNMLTAKIASRTKMQNIDLLAEFDRTKQVASELFTYQLIMMKLFREFASAVRICEGQLKLFVEKVSTHFSENLKKFDVSGELELSLWKKGVFVQDRRENDKLLQSLENDATFPQIIEQSYGIIAEELTLCMDQFDAVDYLRLIPSKKGKKDKIQESSEEEQPIKFVDPSFLSCFKSHDALDQFFKQYLEPELLTRFQKNFDAFIPQLTIKTQFAKGEKLQHASLSGGEKSVTSLCLAACADQAAFNLIDEINQGMDEKFEKAAHQLICQLKGQVIVSSPKLGPEILFEGVQVHCLMGKVK